MQQFCRPAESSWVRLSPGGPRHVKAAIAGAQGRRTTQPNGLLMRSSAAPVVCPRCKGEKEISCPACKGTGEQFGRYPCANCVTRCIVICPRCKGKGIVKHDY